jgi:anti-anti-sigma factor
MNLQEHTRGPLLVLRPEGPLIGDDADGFKDGALEAFRRSIGRFVVDAAAVPYVDSRGLEALVEVNQQMASGGQILKLCGLTPTVRQVLELTGLSRQFDYFEDVTAAARSFL